MKYLLIPLLLLTASMGYSQGTTEPEFTRQQCIQKVDLDWNGYSKDEIEKSIEGISIALRELDKNQDGMEIPSYIIPFHKRDEWYLQYRHDCTRKKENTLKIIAHLSSTHVINQPKYRAVDVIVTPSSKTISLKGEFWKVDLY
jgi:hypothetical protein